ncbi:MAG: SDR family oxidoreductase [Gammaproteobacteria bacterium]|nr:SDR family oxidoreductase [Gammaproteobacteria bacterium]
MNLLLVTGASAGIGTSTAEAFLEAGYAVVNLSRRPCPVAGVTHVRCDLSRPDFLADIAEALATPLASADRIALVHNASRLVNDTALATPSDALRAILETNVVAANTLNGHVLPHMGPGSCILYVGSTLSEKAVPGSFSYVVSKHAIVGMMRATCQDLAGSGIHTACVCPGFTDTEMLREHVPDDAMASVSAMSAFGRLIAPAEIAATLLFAAENAVLNGAVLHANLGQVER